MDSLRTKKYLFRATLACLFFGSPGAGGMADFPQVGNSSARLAPKETGAILFTAVKKADGSPAVLRVEDVSITQDKVPMKIEKVTCNKPEPVLIGILVDVSASRRRDPLLNSHYAMLQDLANRLIQDKSRVFLVDFSNTAVELGSPTDNQSAVAAAFKQLRLDAPRGSTSMYDTVSLSAGEEFSRSNGPRSLIVVGDWEDNSSAKDMPDTIERAQRLGATVYAVVDVTDDVHYDKKFYKHALSTAEKFTNETGGQTFDVHGEKDFASALNSIQRDIDGTCRVEYSAPPSSQTTRVSKLHIEVRSKEVEIRYPKASLSGAP